MAGDGKKAAAVGGVIVLTIFGIWGLTRKAKAVPPENIVLSDLLIEPTTVYVGEPVSISVVATNIGETAGSYEVTCEVM